LPVYFLADFVKSELPRESEDSVVEAAAVVREEDVGRMISRFCPSRGGLGLRRVDRRRLSADLRSLLLADGVELAQLAVSGGRGQPGLGG